MPRQIVHGALSVLTLVVASSAWAAPAPWVPNTTGNVGPAPTTFNVACQRILRARDLRGLYP